MGDADVILDRFSNPISQYFATTLLSSFKDKGTFLKVQNSKKHSSKRMLQGMKKFVCDF